MTSISNSVQRTEEGEEQQQQLANKEEIEINNEQR